MRQKTVITKLLLQSATKIYYKVGQVLQSPTVITKWNVTFVHSIEAVCSLGYLSYYLLRVNPQA